MKLDGSKDEVATRLESLEEENRQLKAPLTEAESRTGLSRRGLLTGGAGLVGAVAGAGLVAGSRGASAATPAARTRASAGQISPLVALVPEHPAYLLRPLAK
jgi:hypothetical protein